MIFRYLIERVRRFPALGDYPSRSQERADICMSYYSIENRFGCSLEWLDFILLALNSVAVLHNHHFITAVWSSMCCHGVVSVSVLPLLCVAKAFSKSRLVQTPTIST